jgi:S1-C subfamily serine protease
MRRLVLVLALAGCKPAVDPAGPAPIEEDDPAAGGVRAAPEPGDRAEPAPVRRGGHTIERKALDGCPGEVLAGMRIKAQFQGERFYGWRIDRFWPDDPRYTGVDLRPGDVVVSVNDQPLATPDQMYEVCRKLHDADAVRVRGVRAGAAFELVFPIVGPPPNAPPRS